CSDMNLYPQTMINVPISKKMDPQSLPVIQDSVKAAESELGDRGRVLLRASGTEPLIRVMVEGQDGVLVDKLANELAACVSDSA
ncbi:MAG: phosphoglucosamine mutase, partial [Proteobacteria bacterium]|nr:phosphoglucosamine mutase [Pseudomonadota bacterium]